MGSLRTLLHLIITVAVVGHGAWMAMMPLAHAAPTITAEAKVCASSESAVPDEHAHHANRQHHHAHHHDRGDAHGSHHAVHSANGDAEALIAHAGHGGGSSHDHDMVGCECTLCKITSLAAVDVALRFAALQARDARPSVQPAQQVRVTTGPPVGLRAPPSVI